MAMAAAGARAGASKAAGKSAAKAGGAGAGAGAMLPGAGDWKKRSQESRPKGGGGSKGLGGGALKGSQGKYRRMLIAEFIVCVIILGLSPLAKGSGEMGPVRFMKRGSATCAFFIILGLVSAMGKGAGRAAAMFGALVTLVLLVDQREAFGKLATVLNADDSGKDEAAAATVGPDDSTDDAGSVMV